MSTLQLQQNGVEISPISGNYDYQYYDPNETITFSCPQGHTLSDSFGSAIPAGHHTIVCPQESADHDDYTPLNAPNLQCIGPSTPPPTSTAPTPVPTLAPSSKVPVTRNDDEVEEETHHYDCKIPQMTGIVGYQASSNQHQIEVVRYPLSEMDGSSYYLLRPNDTITFVCEDESQSMKLDGVSLEPHSVNFYTYTCIEEETSDHLSALSLTCAERRLRN